MGVLIPTGFSASRDSLAVTGSTQIGGWSTTSPYYDEVGFDEVSGNFTVPVTGRYSISATINYTTTVTASLLAGVDPAFVVRRTSAPITNLVSGLFPILSVTLPIVGAVRVVLGNGTVTLAGDVELTANDVVGLFYEADGLTLSVSLGGAGAAIVWSMHRIV